MPTYLMTQSLLSSWLWIFKSEDEDKAYQDFLDSLNKVDNPANEAMMAGRRFEDCINEYVKTGKLPPEHEWNTAIKKFGDFCRGGQSQVSLSKHVEIEGMSFLLYGKLDYLKAGQIIDIKKVASYEYGKYFDSPQHPMYFEFVPQALKFVYLIFDGKYMYREVYRPIDCVDIKTTIRQFMEFLRSRGLEQIYFDNWKARE